MPDSQPPSSPPVPEASRPTSPARRKRKRKHRPWMLQKESRRRMKQYAAEASTLVQEALPIAKTLSENASIPGLSIGLEALLTILKKIDTMRTNIEGVETLKTRVTELMDIVKKCPSQPDKQQFKNIRQRLDALSKKLSEVAAKAEGIKSRNMIKRFFTSNSDAKKLQGLVEDINTAIQEFLLEAMLNLEVGIHVVRQDMNVMCQDVKATQLDVSFISMYAKNAQYDSDVVRRGCLEGTRKEVLADVDDWFLASSQEAAAPASEAAPDSEAVPNSEDSEGVPERPGHILWINGLAGTGKTTVAYTVVEKYKKERKLAANFFCSRSDAECSDPKLIFVTIARQLCQYHAPFKERVAEIVKQDPDLMTAGPLRQFQELILRPLRELKGVFPTCVIVIDALDECRDKNITSVILGILARYMRELGPFLFVITSRPEPHITAMFERAHEESLKDATKPLVLHDVHLDSILDDIRRCLGHGFGEIRKAFFIEGEWPSNHDLNALAELSKGLFIFATTVLRFIGDQDCSNPKKQLQALLEASVSIMNDLYREVLALAYKNVDILHKINPSLRRVLGAITLAEEPLSATALANLLGMSESDVRNVLSKLRAVLHVPEEGSADPIRFIHPTFPEFLLSTSMVKPEAFCIIPAEHHLTLFTRSLVAMDDLTRNIAGIEKPTLFRSEIPGCSDIVKTCIPAHVAYASRFWSAHLSRCVGDTLEQDHCDLLSGFLTRQMLYWIETCSLLGILDGALAALEVARHTCQNLNVPFATLVAPLADYYRFLWTYYSCIDTAPLQVYYSALALSPTESLVRKAYSQELDGSLIMRRGALSNWLPRRDAFTGHDGKEAHAIAFSPDGECFVTGGGDKRMKIWKTLTRTMVQSFDRHTSNVYSVAFSPDGLYIASGSGDVRIWQVSSGECVCIFKGYTESVMSVTYSADGCRLLSATIKGNVKLWDTSNRRCILTFKGTFETDRCITFQAGLSPDGGVIARGCGASLSLYKMSSAAEETFDFPDRVEACTFSPDGCLVAARSTYVIRIWQCVDKSLVRSIEVDEVMVKLRSRLAFSRDGTRLACGSESGSVYLWHVASENPPLVLPGHPNLVWDVSWSPDGLQVASAFWGGIIQVCNATQFPTHTEEPDMSQPRPVPSKPPRFAVARDNHGPNIVLFHLPPTKVDISRFAASMPEGAPILTFFATIADAWDAVLGTIYLPGVTRAHAWAVITGQQRVGFSFTTDPPMYLSPDGSLLGYSSPTTGHVVDVCDLHTGDVVASLIGHTDSISSIAFSPDGALIATASNDRSVKVWKGATGNIVHSHEGHTHSVNALAFSSDSRLVASGSSDRSVHVFEAETGHVEGLLNGHRSFVWEVVFTPEDKRVLVLDMDEWVYIWDIATGTRTYEVNIANASWTRSLIFSSDGTNIPVEEYDPGARPLPLCDTGSRTWPAYAVSKDGWVYARSPGRAARLCWLPQEWRNLVSWDGASFCCLDEGRHIVIEFDVSRLPEYIGTWGRSSV